MCPKHWLPNKRRLGSPLVLLTGPVSSGIHKLHDHTHSYGGLFKLSNAMLILLGALESQVEMNARHVYAPARLDKESVLISFLRILRLHKKLQALSLSFTSPPIPSHSLNKSTSSSPAPHLRVQSAPSLLQYLPRQAHSWHCCLNQRWCCPSPMPQALHPA